MNKTIAAAAVAAALLGGSIYISQDDAVQAGWDRPTTDAEWAEDVKKENFDIKSTGVLEQMIESHTEKLAREARAFQKYEQCPECIYYEFYEQFIASGYSEADAEDEAIKQRDDTISQRKQSIQKLQQSIERMEKELELREKGFVVVAAEPEALEIEGDAVMMELESVPPERIRHIND